MTTVDIRSYDDEEITCIKFADEDDVYYNAQFLVKCGKRVKIQIKENKEIQMSVRRLEDAENLIKALQKAIELGWWKS